jgi:putative membrane protein
MSTFVGAQVASARLGTQLGNWRLFLVHVISGGVAVTITVLLLPGLWFTGWGWGEFLRIALVAGVLNATVKPLLQFVALRYLIASYGIAVVLVNTAVLFLLGVILHGDIDVRGGFALLAGGFVVGILGMIFDALLGTGTPILDTADPQSRAPEPHTKPEPVDTEGAGR